MLLELGLMKIQNLFFFRLLNIESIELSIVYKDIVENNFPLSLKFFVLGCIRMVVLTGFLFCIFFF